MFWSGNYIGARELNVLLKEGNVTLTQVLEAYDILQECKADNKALIQFLTKPEILAELITLVTEEPPKNVELTSQYRHANIASEVLASNLFTLRDRLSMDVVQMNRLCDFVNRDPPLNPLLASYFSKTIEILLQRSPKQDWYMHNIVCLRVLDFFKSRRDFLPNLLRHISTSAICDTFKCFLSLTDPFNEIIIEWLDEYQFLDSLIHIICGTYDDGPPADGRETLDSNHNAEKGEGARARARARAGGAANAAALLVDAALDADGAPGARALCARLRADDAGRRLLQAAFTAPPAARRAALVHCCRLLLALLQPADGADADLEALERAIAPHLPLLHNALLRAPDGGAGGAGGVGAERVHAAALLARLAQSEVDDVPTALITLGTAGVLIDMLFAYPHNNFLHAQVCALIRNAMENRRFGDRYTKHLIEECDLLTRLMDAFEQNEDRRAVRAGYMGHVLGALRALRARAAPGAAHGARWAAFCERALGPLLLRLDTPLGGVDPAESAYEVGSDQPRETMTEGYQIYLQLVTAAKQAKAMVRADGDDDAGRALQGEGFLDLEIDDKNMWDDEPDDDGEAQPGGASPWDDAGRGGAAAGARQLIKGANAEADTEEEAEASADRSLESGKNFLGMDFDDKNMWDDEPDDDGEAQPCGASPWGGAGGGAGGDVAEGWASFDGFAQGDPFWPSAEVESERRDERQGESDIHDDKDTLTILLAQKMLTAFRNMTPDGALLQGQPDVPAEHSAREEKDAPEAHTALENHIQPEAHTAHDENLEHEAHTSHEEQIARNVHQVCTAHEAQKAHETQNAHEAKNATEAQNGHEAQNAHEAHPAHEAHTAPGELPEHDAPVAHEAQKSHDVSEAADAPPASPGAAVQVEL